VQNKTGSEPLTQSVLAQWPREKVKILKFWLLGAFWGIVDPEPCPPEGIFFQILILRQKLSGNMKNHGRSLFSF